MGTTGVYSLGVELQISNLLTRVRVPLNANQFFLGSFQQPNEKGFFNTLDPVFVQRTNSRKTNARLPKWLRGYVEVFGSKDPTPGSGYDPGQGRSAEKRVGSNPTPCKLQKLS